MSAAVSIAIHMQIHDERTFREAARDRALTEHLGDLEAARYLDEAAMTLEQCAIMLLDPGTGPAGSTILESGPL